MKIKGIYSLAIPLTDISAFFILLATCLSFHLFLMISHQTRIQVSKYISAINIAVVILIIFTQVVSSFQITTPRWSDFVIFDKGRNLQAAILLFGSFRFNKEILELKDLDQRIKKFDDEEGIKGYSKASVYYYLVLGGLFGYLYYLEHLNVFHSDNMNLENAIMLVYSEAGIFLKLVILVWTNP